MAPPWSRACDKGRSVRDPPRLRGLATFAGLVLVHPRVGGSKGIFDRRTRAQHRPADAQGEGEALSSQRVGRHYLSSNALKDEGGALLRCPNGATDELVAAETGDDVRTSE